SVKPSKRLIEEVTNALEHNNPYRELIKIFRKLYRMSYLIVDEMCLRHNDEKIEWKTLDDFKNVKRNGILIICWSELYPLYEIFYESYLNDVKYILGINDLMKSSFSEKLLMAGVISIEEL
ncbi:10811_t:CDS:2, partial [Gigaspora margarita]